MRAEPDRVLYSNLSDTLAIDFSSEGSLLASAHSDGTVRVCYPFIAEELWRFEPESSAYLVKFSPDCRTVVAAPGWERVIYAWNVSNGVLRLIETPSENVRLHFNSFSHRLASLNSDVCNFWDVELGEFDGSLEFDGEPIADFNFSRDGTLVAVCQLSEVRIWDVQWRGLLRSFRRHSAEVRVATFSPDGKHVASASTDGALILWDAHTMATRWTAPKTPVAVNYLDFDRSGKLLAAGYEDRSIRIYETNTGKIETTLFFGGPIYDLTFSHEDVCLAVAGEGPVSIWCDDSRPAVTVSERFSGATGEAWLTPY